MPPDTPAAPPKSTGDVPSQEVHDAVPKKVLDKLRKKPGKWSRWRFGYRCCYLPNGKFLWEKRGASGVIHFGRLRGAFRLTLGTVPVIVLVWLIVLYIQRSPSVVAPVTPPATVGPLFADFRLAIPEPRVILDRRGLEFIKAYQLSELYYRSLDRPDMLQWAEELVGPRTVTLDDWLSRGDDDETATR